VIPAQFEYVAPASVAEAVTALGEAGEDGKVLAGGQSLIPVLRLRLAFPSTLVDLRKIEELRGVREDGDALVIGAMTRHDDVLKDPLVRQHAALVAEATATVADPAVRHRGTFGGALAHADPAGDLAAVALALDATFVVEGPGGRRSIAASDFFVDYLETAMRPEEILVEVRVPKLEGQWGVRYEKFNRVAQAWAIVGVAAAVRRDDGSIAEARIGLTNMGSTPVRARATEAALAGARADVASVKAAAGSAAEGTSPPSDLNGAADYRQHLARVLTARAVGRAAGLPG
jgi:carbon-monoxide dehydrogenase medium subunit